MRQTGRRHFADRFPVIRVRLAVNRGKSKMAATADLAALRIDDFTPHLDAVFDTQTPGGAVPLKLVRVDPAGDSGRAGGAFSLIFVAPKGTRLPQAIYPVTHPVLGVMEIFLVPIRPTQDGNGYQAVFT
jgi:hypothetical protein